MSFKIKPGYNKDDMNIPVHHVNLTDGSVGKSNHGGILVKQGLNPVMEKAVIAHETVHQKDPKLDYDENYFYYGDKKFNRNGSNKVDEFDKNLPFEKPAYAASDKILKGYRGNSDAAKLFRDKGLITYNGEEEIT